MNTPLHGHYRTICPACGRVVEQCRCPGEKQTRVAAGACDHCQGKETQAPPSTSVTVDTLHATTEAGLEEAIVLTGERMLPFFRFGHLPLPLQSVSAVFARAAVQVVQLPASAERTVALRKLLEGKDAAVRAAL